MRRILIVGIIILVICPMVYGQESKSNENWEFNLAPMYLWAVSIEGDQTVIVRFIRTTRRGVEIINSRSMPPCKDLSWR